MHKDLVDFWKSAPEDTFDALLECAPLLMQALDAEGRIVRVSAFWADLLGYRPEELIGRKQAELLTPESREVVETEITPELLSTGRSHGHELTVITKSGDRLPVVHSSTLMLDRQGKFLRSLAIFADNRATMEARDQLNRIAREAEEASRAKSRFLAAMSHEIRTPMNAILGFAQLLKISNLDAKRKSHVDAIIAAGGSLMNLLTDLLDLSQVEEGKMRIEMREFELRDLLDQVADWWHSSATQKGLRLNVTLDRGLPRRVKTDPIRLQQVLNNFLANAVKFTSEGIVTLRVELVSLAAKTAVIRFEVEDTGLGMSQAQMERLFRPFVQIETDFSKDHGGWGLGLSICSNIAKKLGAKIGVESVEGKGSVFRFELEVEIAEIVVPAVAPAAERTTRTEDGERLKVLLAEDNPANQDLMRIMLNDLGHDVVTVGNGFEAVQATMQGDYDIIIMDVMMPGLDGVAATEQIRNPENPLHDVPILACSAHVAEEARQRYLKTGMDAFIPKPIDREELRTVIHTLVHDRPAATV